MIVLAFDSATAENVTSRRQTVVTYPESWLSMDRHYPRGRVRVDLASLVGRTVAIARLPEFRGSVPIGDKRLGFRAPGAIVGSATVTACVPMPLEHLTTMFEGWPPGREPPHCAVCGEWVTLQPVATLASGRYAHPRCADGEEGRWALILDGAEPCEVNCPNCIDVDEYRPCRSCDDGPCAPIPFDATGPITEWTP